MNPFFTSAVVCNTGPLIGLARVGMVDLPSRLFPNVIILETPWYQLEADILKAGPAIVSGRVEVPATPGLGIVVDEEVVRDYRVEAFPRK